VQYRGRYTAFDSAKIGTYPLAGRANKVAYESLLWPKTVLAGPETLEKEILERLDVIAAAVLTARQKDRAVIWFTGAHLIKNGMGPLLADAVEKGWVSLVAGNGATAIHDFELAMIGQTSEHVPNALPEGRFGMAYEFACFNAALAVGNRMGLGFGESLGRTICDDTFRREVAQALLPPPPEGFNFRFEHPEASVLARAWRKNVPVTIHAGVGTDVTDQHTSFDGEAKGGASGRDFLIYAHEATRLEGGVVLNIASAVTGPEVFLKAVSMAGNIGRPPKGLVTADFDLRPYDPVQMTDESRHGYYFRDQKSIVTRVPVAFKGKGYYVQGDQRQTFPALYRALYRQAGVQV